jgi:hypothetical protein
VPRTIAHNDDIDSCGLTFSEIQELWLGVGPNGSLFSGEEELREAWDRGRAVVMRLWARDGKRPMAWWYLEAPALGLEWPGADRQRSYLYAAGVLSESERREVEAEWKREFDAAKGKGACERREHLAYHDVPNELIREWTAARGRRRRSRAVRNPPAEAPEKAPSAASSAEGREEKDRPEFNVATSTLE